FNSVIFMLWDVGHDRTGWRSILSESLPLPQRPGAHLSFISMELRGMGATQIERVSGWPYAPAQKIHIAKGNSAIRATASPKSIADNDCTATLTQSGDFRSLTTVSTKGDITWCAARRSFPRSQTHLLQTFSLT